MQEKDSELCLTVTGTRRDGRRRYDPQSKRRLAQACLQPGVSLAGMALKHGVNANLLRKWVLASQFVPVVMASRAGVPMEKFAPVATSPTHATGTSSRPAGALLRAQLPNGVTFELACSDQDVTLVSAVIDSLGRCDVSPRC
jgi:transposase